MHSNEMSHQGYVIKLITAEQAPINIGRLPKGSYRYTFQVHNVIGSDGTLLVHVRNEGIDAQEKVFHIKEMVQEAVFSFSSSGLSTPVELIFFLKKGQVTIYLPVSPVVIMGIKQQPLTFKLGELIDKRVNELEPSQNDQPSNSYSNLGGVQTIDLSTIESFVNARYFKGFLSLEDAERQLDYVIFYKMFNPQGTSGFIRMKKVLYRRLLRGIYRLLTKNRPRKLYFAKVYRNYVNSNLISENYHNH